MLHPEKPECLVYVMILSFMLWRRQTGLQLVPASSRASLALHFLFSRTIN
jgi:hypothetical protein